MPIEIRELVIRATVADNSQQQQPAAQSSGTGGAVDESTVQKIVDQVLTRIGDKNER